MSTPDAPAPAPAEVTSSLSRSRSSSNASGSQGSRPLPVLATEDTSTVTTKSEPQPEDEDSDGDTGRHSSSSKARTQFTSLTPAAEKAAMQSLKTKMTFSDNSAPSSAASTPSKPTQPHLPLLGLTRGAMTDPPKLRNSHQQGVKKSGGSAIKLATRLSATAHMNGAESDDQSDELSEGEITSSVTISALLSKLDSVRNFLKEAESLRRRFEDKVTEAGVTEQIAKLDKLILELKQQESSHLELLSAVLAESEGASAEKPHPLRKKDYEEMSEEGESEGESEESDEDDPANQTVIRVGKDDSLSLKAQVEERRQQNAKQEEELAVLRQQQELLQKLLTQQRRIQELELRQAALLKMKERAEEQIAEAEAESDKMQQRLAEEAVEEEEEEEREDGESGQPVAPQSGSEQRQGAPNTSGGFGDGGEGVSEESENQQTLNDSATFEPPSIDQDSLLLMKLAEIKARKERVEQLVSLLGAMKRKDAAETAANLASSERSEGEKVREAASFSKEQPKAAAMARSEDAGNPVGLSSEAVRGGVGGRSELVADDDIPRMMEIRERIQKAEAARKKLRELQDMIAQLHVYTPDMSEPEDEDGSPTDQLRWRLGDRDGSGRGQLGVASSDGEESDDEAEEEGNVTLNTTLTEDFDPAEQSVLEEYRERLEAKRREVAELQRQRDELRRTQERLAMFTSRMMDSQQGDASVQPKVKGQPRRGRLEDKAADTTAATWGGSTVTSEIEEGEKSPASSASLPSAILADTTQDSILPNASALAGSASVEERGASQGKPPFKVTRHTPRTAPPIQRTFRMRTISSPADQAQRKRRKLDVQNVSTASWQQEPLNISRPANPNPYTATSFESPLQQRSAQLDTSHMTTDSTPYYASLLHSQLALTSNMCSELLHTQNNLVGVVCSHLEAFGCQAGMQQQLSAMAQYQRDLEQYYHDLHRSYVQMTHHQSTTGSAAFQTAGPQAEAGDPDASMTNQQLDETQASTTEGVLETNEMPVGGAQEGAPRVTPPPPPLSGQPRPFHFRGFSGQQQSGAGVSFMTNPEGVANTTGENSGFGSLPAPPIPPPTFNPYQPPFPPSHHLHPYYGGAMMSRSYGNAPPFGPPRFTPTGYPQFAPPRPHPLPISPYASPLSYPRHLHWGAHSPQPATYGSPGRGPPFAPPFGHAPPVPIMPPTPPFAVQLPPHLPPFVPGPASNLSTGLADRSGVSNIRPSSLLPAQAHLQEDHLGFYSPSGVTASSLQVHPPSSPPSAPSVNYQQSSSNQNNCNATSTAMPKFGAAQLPATGANSTIYNPSSMVNAVHYPSFPPTTSHAFSFVKATGSGPMAGSGTAGAMGQFKFSTASQPVTQGVAFTASAATGGGVGVEGEGDQRDEDEVSVSSLPVSLPEELSNLRLDTLDGELLLQEGGQQEQLQGEGGEEDGGALGLSDLPSGFSVFDALRDTIYSEVATLIANNESRPHFLVELFRELQMLTTDYLRQRALYNLQDLVTRYLTEEGVAHEAKAIAASANLFQGWATGSVSEHTPSENGVTTEEELVESKPPLTKTNSQKYDYVEPVNSASSLSTPPNSSSLSGDQPFASDSLGATAVRLDKALAKVKGEVLMGGDERGLPFGLTPPVISPGPLKTGDEMLPSDVNTEQLDELIKVIMIEVIPIFKNNLDSHCTDEILAQIKQTIIELIVEQEDVNDEKRELFGAFTKQLEVAINSAVEKYGSKLLKDCGEDLLVEISEVLFNELTFFRLLKDFKGHPQLNSELEITSSQENEEEEEPRSSHEAATGPSHQPLDHALLQALALAANANFAQEEESLGNLRDDALAASWDVKMQEGDHSSLSVGEDSPMKVVELSLSESQPFESTGSGEEDNGNVDETYVIIDSVEIAPAHLSDNDARETTPTSAEVEEQLPGSSVEAIASEQHEETATAEDDSNARAAHDDMERGGATPPTPTPQAEPKALAESNKVGDSSKDDREGGEGDVRERSSDGGEAEVEGGEDTVGGSEEGQGEESAPPTDQQIELKGIDEAALDAQVKTERDKVEGVAGILASIEETGMAELAGEGEELATPTPGYVEP